MTSGKASRETREAKAAARRAAAARAESRRKNSIRIGVAVVVVLVVVGFGALIQSQRGSTSDSTAVPANTSGATNGVITVGPATAPVTVTVYEDFQCPYCAQFEAASNTKLQSYVEAGTAKVEYHPMAFLDEASTTKYSSRALNAVGCVVNAKPDAFEKFHNLLFANQPKEGSAGLPDSKLIDLAKQAGASDVGNCIKDQTYSGWVQRITDQASKDNVTTTPTVLVNGKKIDNPLAPTALSDAIEAGAK